MNEGPLHFVTPITEDGPLYPPVEIPIRSDLTKAGTARGQVLILMGVVKNFKDQPVSNAHVEIWQADSNGYYDHPRARGADALDDYWKISQSGLDPNFDYFGAVKTSGDGVYWFQTVVPRWYHVFGTDRAAHIHAKMRHPDNGVLTTELYFPGEEHERHRSEDKVFGFRIQQPDLLVEFVESAEARLPGVPLVSDVKYCRKDLTFL